MRYYSDDDNKKSSARLRTKPPDNDKLTSLFQQVNNLQKDFFNDNEMLISEQIHQQFGHLLARMLYNIQMYFIDCDMHTKQFSDNISHVSEVLLERQKQLKRLFCTGILSNDDNEILAYEVTLQRRMNEFNLLTGDQQSFVELKVKFSNVFDLYIRQCLHLHSTLNIRGISENIDVLTKRFSEQQIIVDEKQRESLELALNNFDIPLIYPPIICHKTRYARQNQLENFLPSQTIDYLEQKDIDVSFIDLLKSIRNERWIVLLGGPGSGKTTVMRWLTCEFARNLLIEQKNMIIHDTNMGPVRVPILIRIGEFSQWLQGRPSSNLFDYIGQHTWLGQMYINSEFKFLQDFVRYGHALIILDGLDEVTTFEVHNRVNNLVQDFIQSYCMSHEFVLPFDDEHMAAAGLGSNFQCESLSRRNMIVLTSRIINYTAQPLHGNLISHYSIQPMNIKYLDNFIENWCFHVQEEISDLLIRHIPGLKQRQTKYKSFLNPRVLVAKMESEKGLGSLASNLSVLSIICMLFTRYGIDVLEKTRVRLYQQVVELMLQRWQNRQSKIPKDALMSIFSDMAFYIHSHSGSGLIDELDLTHLCRFSLRRWYNQNSSIIYYDSIEIRQQTEQFLQLLSEDAGIAAARALCIYGFLHLTFQEYFVCLSLVNVDHLNIVENTKELIDRYLSLCSNPRLREPLYLAMGWISLYWSSENFDHFCLQLQSKTHLANKHIPIGSLLFLGSLEDLASLPQLSTICNSLDSLLEFDIQSTRCVFETELSTALDRLPIDIVTNWFDRLFMKEDPIVSLKILCILYNKMKEKQPLPQWITPIFCETLWRQFGRVNEETDIYIDRILMIIGAMNSDCLPLPTCGLRTYLLSRANPKLEIHSTILAAIVALYGGLEYNDKSKQNPSITFMARRIHRDSSLSSLFIEYLNDTTQDQAMKLQYFIDKCRKTITTAISTNITPAAVHGLVVLFFIYGIDQSSNYEQYIGSELWQRAMCYIKIVLLYLREFFCIDPRSKFKKNLIDIFKDFSTDSKDTLDLIQSMSHAYPRLLCAETSFFTPKHFVSDGNYLINIKIPTTIELENIAIWDDNVIIRRLAFICCITSSKCFMETEELEDTDLSLLNAELHPFQLLQNKPVTLLLAYVPSSVQHLYIELFEQKQISFDETSPLPFFHLLIGSLHELLMTQWPCIRLCILLSTLRPTIVQYKMENFVRIFTNKIDLRHKSKRLLEFFDRECYNSFTRLVEIETADNSEDINRELALEEERHRIENSQNDFELYAACCCFAKLTRKNHGTTNEPPEMKLEKLWAAVQAIKEPLWRLDAAINIFYIMLPMYKNEAYVKDHMKCQFFRLIAWMEELESTTPLLSYVAIFTRCMSFIRNDFPVDKRLIYNILQRLKTVTIAEQFAIYKALIALPPFRQDVCQFIHQSQCYANTVTFAQIYPSNFILFSKYFSTTFLKISNITKVRSIFLTSMYLSEIISYIQFLNDSVSKKTHYHITNESTSQTSFEKCLLALQMEPIKSLTVEAASTIDAFLSTSITEMDKIQIIRIEQAIMKKTNIIESARPYVVEWLKYRGDKILCSFAYYGALLLASSKIWRPTIVEMCCELLTNENDHLRTTAIKLIDDQNLNIENQGINIIIHWLDNWNEKETKKRWEIVHLFSTLYIETIDQIEQIIQAERNRVIRTLEKNPMVSDCIVSSFRLIKEVSSEVKDYVLTIMISLFNSPTDSTDLLFLQWFFEHFPSELLALDERFVEFLIKILIDCQQTKIKIAVGKILIHFRRNESIQNILWTIVTNNIQENSDEFIAACILSLNIDNNYSADIIIGDQSNDIIVQERLKQIDHFRQHAYSLLIRQAALARICSHVEKISENYDIIEVYYSHMINAMRSSAKKASDWITGHTSVLLTLFIEDICKNFDNASVSIISAYIEVAALVCQQIADDFRNTVRQIPNREITFRKGVYEISKNVGIDEKNCLIVYACFEEVTLHFIEMIMEAALKTLKGFNHYEYVIQCLRFISGRQLIEVLFDILHSSKSLRQRSTAGVLLVHLAYLNHVSLAEVQKLLNAAIEDPWSQHYFEIDEPQTRADYRLKRQLIRLLIGEEYYKRSTYLSTINMNNKADENRIPAAIFEKFNK